MLKWHGVDEASSFVRGYVNMFNVMDIANYQSGPIASGSAPQFVAATSNTAIEFKGVESSIVMTRDGNSPDGKSGYQSTTTPVGQYTSVDTCISILEVNSKNSLCSSSLDEDSTERDDRPP